VSNTKTPLSLCSLATEIGQDLALWPVGPSRVLQIDASQTGTVFADTLPYAKLTILTQQPIPVPTVSPRYQPLNFRIGHWAEVEWGDDYEVIICFDLLRHLTNSHRVAFLGRAQRSLAKGGRTIAIELIAPGDVAAQELQHAGTLAGCERFFISSTVSDESWSTVVFERDVWSAY
jgi:hypothetical protein